MSDSQNKKALKSGIWYIMGNFLIKGIGFITTPFFSRLMTKEDIGDFSNLLTWIGILSIIFTFDFYSSIAVARFDYKEDLNDYVSSSLVLGSGITLFFFGLTFPFKSFLLRLINVPDYAYYYAFIYMLVYPAIQMFQAKSQVEYKYKASLLVSILSAVGAALLSLFLVRVMNNQLYGRIIGYFIPFIAFGFGVYLYLVIIGKRISTKYWKYAFNISFPLVFHLLAGYILSSSDRIMIRSLIDSRALGLYSVAYSGAMIISVLMTSMNSAWVPWAMAQIDSDNINELRKTSRFFVLFFGILVLGIIMLGPEVLLIMGGKSYMEAIDVIPPVMVGFVFQFVYSLYVNIEQYYKKQRMVAIGTVIAAGSNIILNWLLIPVLGYVAAAYTTLLSYIILFVVHYFFVKMLQKDKIYDGKFNITILIGSLFMIPIMTLLYHYNIIRLIIVGIMIVSTTLFAIKYRRILLKAIKTKSLGLIIDIFHK